MAIETKQLHALSKIYREQVAEDMQKGYVVTAADKKGNTKAWQGYKSGAKKKDGTALYTAADHLKNEEVVYEKVATGPRLGEPREKGATHMNAGEQGKISKRTKAWMDKKGQKGAPGLDAMKARTAEHQAKRGVKKEGFSDWRHDLKEIPDYEQIPASAKKRNEKIEEKDVKNTVKINPEMKEELKIIEEYVDELSESDIADILARLEKKRISKGGNPDESPLGKKVGQAMKSQQDKARKKAGLKTEDVEIEEGVYEKQKTKEVMGALKKRDLKTDVKKKIAADIVKKKGDTSKSDDRYAYESKLWDEVAENLTQLGELNDADFRVEGYQRNPEADPRSARQRRMDDPDTGINSQAFRDFMAAQQRPAKKKPVAKKKDSK